jgi:hypothetical protein
MSVDEKTEICYSSIADEHKFNVECSKEKIINLFRNNLKNKSFNGEKKHYGSEGHWLETILGLTHNSLNKPDLYGYEIKKSSKKITFGDFSASEYIYSKNKPSIDKFNKWKGVTMSREAFIKFFGNKNPKKNNRYSWSGSCIPKYGEYNSAGTILLFNSQNDLCIYYNKKYDKRE